MNVQEEGNLHYFTLHQVDQFTYFCILKYLSDWVCIHIFDRGDSVPSIFIVSRYSQYHDYKIHPWLRLCVHHSEVGVLLVDNVTLCVNHHFHYHASLSFCILHITSGSSVYMCVLVCVVRVCACTCVCMCVRACTCVCMCVCII